MINNSCCPWIVSLQFLKSSIKAIITCAPNDI
ncbi:hypothetical protein CY0110_17027 [Crocosphaera chwakensis CCY0110]|uniref:Uncharacterized protein n=1 Tax=Crocosphaera chwakensis CCY0110 TaxID=391612 RepID=A3II87_9CHRO|nr:hypothetical protein CY0110_17027 [Crocosphaera chwakensis CCY0110]